MEERRWDELDKDCLVEILSRVGMDSLLAFVPFVCKSWYNASLDPKCWKSLVFPHIFDSIDFIKFVVGRSQKSVTSIVFAGHCPKEAFLYISDECPALKSIELSLEALYMNEPVISPVICKWKNLEILKLENCSCLTDIVESVGSHCMNFFWLECSRCYIDNETASALVNFLPKTNYLKLSYSSLLRMDLVMILKGCRDLQLFEIYNCFGCVADDEIFELASHIKTFSFNDSTFGVMDLEYSLINRENILEMLLEINEPR